MTNCPSPPKPTCRFAYCNPHRIRIANDRTVEVPGWVIIERVTDVSDTKFYEVLLKKRHGRALDGHVRQIEKADPDETSLGQVDAIRQAKTIAIVGLSINHSRVRPDGNRNRHCE
jgi:hypothetical protein